MKASLVPFESCPIVQSLGFELVFVGADRLVLRVTVTGAIASKLAITKAPRQRRSGLWNDHCFELFIGAPGSDVYWEWNLAPSGHWQCFRFSQYRKNRTLSELLTLSSCVSHCKADAYALEAELFRSQDPIWQKQSLKIGLCAVIRSGEDLSYFALNHGARPDFHDPHQYVEISL